MGHPVSLVSPKKATVTNINLKIFWKYYGTPCIFGTSVKMPSRDVIEVT